MLYVNLPKRTETLFSVGGFKIGFGINLGGIEESANHKLLIMEMNQQVIKSLYDKIEYHKKRVDKLGNQFHDNDILKVLEDIASQIASVQNMS